MSASARSTSTTWIGITPARSWGSGRRSAQRGRGVATDALRLAGRWLLSECGLARVQLVTEPDNVAMVAAARRAGFLEEGVLRGYVRERGQRVDVTMLSLVAADLVTGAG